MSASPFTSDPSETPTWRASASISLPVPGMTVTFRPLSSRLEALGQPVDHLVLAGLADREVEGRLARIDSELLGAGHRAEHLRRLQQLLGGDTAPVEAGAADPPLLDHRDLSPAAAPYRAAA